jgi:general secretion pathway protein H
MKSLRSAPSESGFTLMELIVVLMIMSLMLVVVPRYVFSGVSGADLRASSRELAAGLRQARSEAVSLRRDTALTIDLEKRSFTLSTHPKVHKLPEALELKLFTAQSEVVNEKQGAIRFFPDGSSTGGRVTVSSGERKYLVDVEWLTGKVSIAQ